MGLVNIITKLELLVFIIALILHKGYKWDFIKRWRYFKTITPNFIFRVIQFNYNKKNKIGLLFDLFVTFVLCQFVWKKIFRVII